ncbi:hypothetical protein H072_7888 [Dactylellina haptotyla CBS 200.50]|uniref:Uncharacterized protein n=1 Tax=Dactylellina haptotyla (strain CBS 200.50) TaxID=1284197 RepID=S8ABB3_DACHA|nr:hypothetical protein H072_7888 [Dactylellina haptotyla CBS 200.50]
MSHEEADAVQEKAAPVHVMELQEGASSAKVPPPIIGLTKSDTFNSIQAGTVSRSNTLTTIREAPGFVQPYQIPQITSPILAPTSPQIPTVVVASPPPSRASMLPLSSPILSQPLVESPSEEGEVNLEQRTTSPPPQPLIPATETLLGKRESMLKATPNFPTVADNTMVYGQAMIQPQPFQQFNTASASSPNLLYRQSMTPTLQGGGYQSHRNSNGTSYAGSLGGYGGTSSRIPSMEVPPGALAGYSPYMSQLNHSLPSVAIPVPQGAVEMAPQAPPQPAPADRRESMLRKWRESLAQDQVISARSKHTMHDRRNEMIQHQALMNAYEKQKEMERGMRDGIVDERFKQRDMLQVHREAMKKMQDKAKGI